MREIKFRAWDRPEKRMVKVGSINWGLPSGIEVNETNVSLPATLMQCTGLKDKNGVEIYEGDIVKGYFEIDDVEYYLWLHLTDEEKSTGTKLFTIEDIFYPYSNHLPPELEVIGNIYENPELLEQTK